MCQETTSSRVNVNAPSQLHCLSKWPHNIIVDEKTMETYSSISSFLLTLLFARWKLDHIWIDRQIRQSTAIHQIQIVRSEMVQFLRGFSDFIFQSVIAAQWFSFVKRVTKFNDDNVLDIDRNASST